MEFSRINKSFGLGTTSRAEFELRALEAPVSNTQPLLSRGLSNQEQNFARGHNTYTSRDSVDNNGRDPRLESQAAGEENEAAVEQPLLAHGATEMRAVRSPEFISLDHLAHWFPKVNPDNPKARPRRHTDRDNALVIQLCLATATLFFNIAATIFASKQYGQKGGIGEIFRGDCRAAEYLNTGLHLIINILSTLLLVASNFCAHILSAPTRDEVDNAHEDRQWLDIGVQV
ncbi:hypothetical protein LTR12_017755 [Friedmanniomyces endolithicus]|nr:hypothetical protein LTR12_017755 [Friedmanniomyces endolithicus]